MEKHTHLTSPHLTSPKPHLTDLHYFLLARSSIPYTALLVEDTVYYSATTLSGDDFTRYISINLVLVL